MDAGTLSLPAPSIRLRMWCGEKSAGASECTNSRPLLTGSGGRRKIDASAAYCRCSADTRGASAVPCVENGGFVLSKACSAAGDKCGTEDGHVESDVTCASEPGERREGSARGSAGGGAVCTIGSDDG